MSASHSSLVAALHRAADDDAELFEFHLGSRERIGARRLRELAGTWASRLHHAGVRAGDTVPILLPTGPHFVGAFLGVGWIGAIPVPLATPMTFGSVSRFLLSFEAVVADCGARFAIASPRLQRAIAALPVHAQLREVLTPGEGALGAAPSLDVPSDALALLQYTSGTTGTPKGVAVTHRALVANADAIAAGLSLRSGDVGVSWLPLFHDMGLVGVMLTALCHPYRVHVLSPESFAMHPRRWLEVLSAERGTISAAPNFAYQMCADRETPELPRLDLTSWRAALDGSEQVHASTLEAFEDRFAPQGFSANAWWPVYGMAENTLAVAFPAPNEPVSVVACDRDALQREHEVREPREGHAVSRAVSVGRPVAGTEIRVRRAGRDVRAGEVGEIQLRGTSRMEGYYRRPELTEACLDEGWLRTGDLGFVRDGRLFVVGRAKEVVVKAGRNVHPPDVERVVCDRPEVRAAAAWGTPDGRVGTERLHVRAETRERDPIVLGALEAGIRGDVLAAIGVRVDEISFCGIGKLPRTTSGKIRRKALAS